MTLQIGSVPSSQIGRTGSHGSEPESIESRHVDQAGPAGQIQRTVAGIDVSRLDRQLGGQQPAQLAVGVADFQAHRHPAAPRRDHLLHRLDEVVVAQLIDLGIAGAGDAKQDAVQDAEAGEEQVGVGRHQILQQREGHAGVLLRHRHQPVEGAGQRHHGDERPVAGRGRFPAGGAESVPGATLA